MKTEEQYKATILRREGWAYSEIQRFLGVSKGSLSRWLQSVPYVPNNETVARRKLASIAAGDVLHQRKLKRVSQIQRDAKSEISQKAAREFLHLLGVVAYWAEGSKTHDNLVAFTNTDPLLIRLVQRWLVESCGVDPGRLRLHIRVHNDIAKIDAEIFWRHLTGIPAAQCEKTTIKDSGSYGRRKRKVRHGIATLKVCDTRLHYRIRGWTEGLIDVLGLAAEKPLAPVAQMDRATPF